MADFNRRIIDEFRANDGRVGGMFAGATLVLLHTRGRRTGAEHVTPLMTWQEDGRLHVIASAAGSPKDPDWFRNLLADPDVSVELGVETFAARATVLDEAARDRIYGAVKAAMPAFAEYEQVAGRTIPVVALDREG
jgi:deazaflavin-dependent oxidoreductase (nitroreductase family)